MAALLFPNQDVSSKTVPFLEGPHAPLFEGADGTNDHLAAMKAIKGSLEADKSIQKTLKEKGITLQLDEKGSLEEDTYAISLSIIHPKSKEARTFVTYYPNNRQFNITGKKTTVRSNIWAFHANQIATGDDSKGFESVKSALIFQAKQIKTTPDTFSQVNTLTKALQADNEVASHLGDRTLYTSTPSNTNTTETDPNYVINIALPATGSDRDIISFYPSQKKLVIHHPDGDVVQNNVTASDLADGASTPTDLQTMLVKTAIMATPISKKKAIETPQSTNLEFNLTKENIKSIKDTLLFKLKGSDQKNAANYLSDAEGDALNTDETYRTTSPSSQRVAASVFESDILPYNPVVIYDDEPYRVVLFEGSQKEEVSNLKALAQEVLKENPKANIAEGVSNLIINNLKQGGLLEDLNAVVNQPVLDVIKEITETVKNEYDFNSIIPPYFLNQDNVLEVTHYSTEHAYVSVPLNDPEARYTISPYSDYPHVQFELQHSGDKTTDIKALQTVFEQRITSEGMEALQKVKEAAKRKYNIEINEVNFIGEDGHPQTHWFLNGNPIFEFNFDGKHGIKGLSIRPGSRFIVGFPSNNDRGAITRRVNGAIESHLEKASQSSLKAVLDSLANNSSFQKSIKDHNGDEKIRVEQSGEGYKLIGKPLYRIKDRQKDYPYITIPKNGQSAIIRPFRYFPQVQTEIPLEEVTSQNISNILNDAYMAPTNIPYGAIEDLELDVINSSATIPQIFTHPKFTKRFEVVDNKQQVTWAFYGVPILKLEPPSDTGSEAKLTIYDTQGNEKAVYTPKEKMYSSHFSDETFQKPDLATIDHWFFYSSNTIFSDILNKVSQNNALKKQYPNSFMYVKKGEFGPSLYIGDTQVAACNGNTNAGYTSPTITLFPGTKNEQVLQLESKYLYNRLKSEDEKRAYYRTLKEEVISALTASKSSIDIETINEGLQNLALELSGEAYRTYFPKDLTYDHGVQTATSNQVFQWYGSEDNTKTPVILYDASTKKLSIKPKGKNNIIVFNVKPSNIKQRGLEALQKQGINPKNKVGPTNTKDQSGTIPSYLKTFVYQLNAFSGYIKNKQNPFYKSKFQILKGQDHQYRITVEKDGKLGVDLGIFYSLRSRLIPSRGPLKGMSSNTFNDYGPKGLAEYAQKVLGIENSTEFIDVQPDVVDKTATISPVEIEFSSGNKHFTGIESFSTPKFSDKQFGKMYTFWQERLNKLKADGYEVSAKINDQLTLKNPSSTTPTVLQPQLNIYQNVEGKNRKIFSVYLTPNSFDYTFGTKDAALNDDEAAKTIDTFFKQVMKLNNSEDMPANTFISITNEGASVDISSGGFQMVANLPSGKKKELFGFYPQSTLSGWFEVIGMNNYKEPVAFNKSTADDWSTHTIKRGLKYNGERIPIQLNMFFNPSDHSKGWAYNVNEWGSDFRTMSEEEAKKTKTNFSNYLMTVLKQIAK